MKIEKNSKKMEKQRSPIEIDNYFRDIIISKQTQYEAKVTKQIKKINGVYLTNNLSIIDQVLNTVSLDQPIKKSILLEPACGNGIFILRFLAKLYLRIPESKFMSDFIEENILWAADALVCPSFDYCITSAGGDTCRVR